MPQVYLQITLRQGPPLPTRRGNLAGCSVNYLGGSVGAVITLDTTTQLSGGPRSATTPNPVMALAEGERALHDLVLETRQYTDL